MAYFNHAWRAAFLSAFSQPEIPYGVLTALLRGADKASTLFLIGICWSDAHRLYVSWDTVTIHMISQSRHVKVVSMIWSPPLMWPFSTCLSAVLGLETGCFYTSLPTPVAILNYHDRKSPRFPGPYDQSILQDRSRTFSTHSGSQAPLHSQTCGIIMHWADN